MKNILYLVKLKPKDRYLTKKSTWNHKPLQASALHFASRNKHLLMPESSLCNVPALKHWQWLWRVRQFYHKKKLWLLLLVLCWTEAAKTGTWRDQMLRKPCCRLGKPMLTYIAPVRWDTVGEWVSHITKKIETKTKITIYPGSEHKLNISYKI